MDLQDIAQKALEQAAEEACKNVIAKHVGYGIEGGLKAIIQEEATRMLREDPELRRKIRDSLIHWIACGAD